MSRAAVNLQNAARGKFGQIRDTLQLDGLIVMCRELNSFPSEGCQGQDERRPYGRNEKPPGSPAFQKRREAPLSRLGQGLRIPRQAVATAEAADMKQVDDGDAA